MRKVDVSISKSYYKSTVVTIEIPDDVQEGDIMDYLCELDDKTSELTDELADASFNSDGSMEIEEWDFKKD